MTQPLLRPVETRDLPRLFEMIVALAAHHGDTPGLTPQALRDDVTGDHPWVRVLVAEADGVPIGYGALCPLAQLQHGVRGMDMHHLFVEAAWRGHGVGRALIEGCVELARALGCRYVTVGTHPDNLAAQQVYAAAGFETLSSPGPRFIHKM
ncbi:GNAT family N-acetyltransferase [Sulfitobacter sp. S190]|uniref:GNAT family N-acetyltransferase n=1 Tax=Sulfitobacter sp. S190 TaxID=2867022 RepID=UPI0021A5199B|nr:GNAT family N-acetyltransferase [Sulfitobacter sp. S190]UWR22781.1 GNAT family N-acetyltransferase [Sulfitobacter sp. S190]